MRMRPPRSETTYWRNFLNRRRDYKPIARRRIPVDWKGVGWHWKNPFQLKAKACRFDPSMSRNTQSLPVYMGTEEDTSAEEVAESEAVGEVLEWCQIDRLGCSQSSTSNRHVRSQSEGWD